MILIMDKEQMLAAREALAAWLAHPNILGRRPAVIRCEGEFDLHDLHYYIFSFQTLLFSGMRYLGVSGGYEKGSRENCGHVVSELTVYDPETAEEEAVRMVEKIRSYWIRRGEESGRMKPNAVFTSCVLLKTPAWDRQAFLDELEEVWHVSYQLQNTMFPDERVIMVAEHCVAAVILMPLRIRGTEAETLAAENYLWKDAKAAAAAHTAYLLVQVNALDGNTEDAAKLLARISGALCREGTLGVMLSETVFEPGSYRRNALSADKAGLFPVLNLIWIGAVKSGEKYSYRTSGMRLFGRKEMEIVHTDTSLRDARKYLLKAAQYVITDGAVLKDGETILLDTGVKGTVRVREGVNVRDETVHIVIGEEDDGRNDGTVLP